MGNDGAPGPKDRTDFDQRLAAARHRAGLDKSNSVGEPQAEGRNSFSLAMRLGAEMVAALVVAVAIGYGLDRLFRTSPWFMIGFVPIGAIAGFRNVVRTMGTTQKD